MLTHSWIFNIVSLLMQGLPAESDGDTGRLVQRSVYQKQSRQVVLTALTNQIYIAYDCMEKTVTSAFCFKN